MADEGKADRFIKRNVRALVASPYTWWILAAVVLVVIWALVT